MTQQHIQACPTVPGSVGPYTRTGFYSKEAAAVQYAFSLLGQRDSLEVLDIGCAHGRTSHEFIENFGTRLVGIDLDLAVIEEARTRLPQGDFRVMDARDLSGLSGKHFDLVFFSFNGIDYIPNIEGRQRCLHEVAKVLKPGGVFSYSSHNLWGLLSNRDSRRILRRNLTTLASGCRFLSEQSDHWSVRLYHGTLASERAHLHDAGLELMRVFTPSNELLPHDPSWRCSDHWPYYVARKIGA